MRNIIVVLFVFSFCFLQAQDISQSQRKLAQVENFISKTSCEQIDKAAVEKQFKSDLKIAAQTLAFIETFFSSPIEIPESAVTKKENLRFIYKSKAHNGLSIKRRIKYGAIPTGFTYEEFTIDSIKVIIQYRKVKERLILNNIETVYPNKIGTYLSRSGGAPYNLRIYSKEKDQIIAYASNRLNIRFGKLDTPQIDNLMVTYDGRERYNWYTDRSGKNSVRCFNDDGDEVQSTQKGNDIEIKATAYLLWYEGFIGKYPIKMMLKRGFNEETDDERILDIAYGYDSKEKWIHPQNFWEPQDGIYGHEKNDDSPEWSVDFEYNQILKGDWDDQNGTILPITLTPMAKEFPEFIFKANITEKLTPSGEVANKTIKGITVYENQKEIQYIALSEGYTIDYFELAHVDINYDGYLDLILDNKYYLYNSTTTRFDGPKDDEPEYYPYLTELEQYNLFTQSVTVSRNRSMVEYRANKGKLVPFHSRSYYPNEDGDMVILEQKYENSKWVTLEERIEKMDEDEPNDYDVVIKSPENYALTCNLEIRNGALLFTPVFHNKTGLEITFNQKAKLYMELMDAKGKVYKKFLHDAALDDDESYMLNDNYIQYSGAAYFLSHEMGLIPFFPIGINQGEYTCKIVLEHELFGAIKTESKSLSFPLALKKDNNIEHYTGHLGDYVNGSIYMYVNEEQARATFINSKTGKNINLKGTYERGIYGLDTVRLDEYEKGDGELSGYFEGKIQRVGKEERKLFEGRWWSPDKKISVPFEFIQQ